MRGSNGGPALSLWLLLGMMMDAALTSETRSCDLYLDLMPGFDFESPQMQPFLNKDLTLH